MKNNYFPKQKYSWKFWVALFHLLQISLLPAVIEDYWFSYMLLHSLCYHIIYQVVSRRLYCTIRREQKKKEMKSKHYYKNNFVKKSSWITLWYLCTRLSRYFQKRWDSLGNLWTLVFFLISYKLRPKKKKKRNTNQVPWNILFWGNLSILKIISHSHFHHCTSLLWTFSRIALCLVHILLSAFSEWKQVSYVCN